MWFYILPRVTESIKVFALSMVFPGNSIVTKMEFQPTSLILRIYDLRLYIA
jgi:hypothetical protein